MSRPEYLPATDFSELTTLGIGGPAPRIARVGDAEAIERALDDNAGREVAVLGGGSNLVVADGGFDGLVLQSSDRSLDYEPATGALQVGAGMDWDELVRFSIERDAAGLECLSGIPGLCGAAPVQNVGAYGQEVSEVFEAVEAFDLRDGGLRSFDAEACAFGYRRSRFKEDEPGRWFLLRLHLRLRPGGGPEPRYGELQRALEDVVDPGLARVREEVIRLRRSKSMVLDPEDPNRRSAGSFFTNPVLDETRFRELARHAGKEPPSWPAPGGLVKVPAAWLIEAVGFSKGDGEGAVGLSDRHVLALVNRGGATAEQLLAFATRIRDRVLEEFGIRLRPEPVPLGFAADQVADLWGEPARR